jgi:hypothetical protein
MKRISFILIVALLISAGITHARVLNKGDTYSDPQGRFTVTMPFGDLVPKKQKEGVVLLGKNFDRGDATFAVLVYPIPDSTVADQRAIERSVQSLFAEIEKKSRHQVKVLSKQETTFKGYPALDIHYEIWDRKWEVDPIALYVSRFVYLNGSVYNMYHYAGGMSIKITPEMVSLAELFFDNVQLGAN